MKTKLISVAVFCAMASTTAIAQSADPLPAWNESKAKQSITDFVGNVTKPGSPDFVPPAERIATFDNDGTLWAEQPLYFQIHFAIDRIKELAPQHPEWKEKDPYKSVLASDLKTAFAGGAASVVEMMAAGHSNMTTEQFDLIVNKWLTTAKHPKTGRLYTEMVYQPMIELLAYLRANGFKTFIVSGGGARFCLFVRHTDAEREWAYDVSPLGRLEKGLEEANAKGWTIVDMKKDWKIIFPFEQK